MTIKKKGTMWAVDIRPAGRDGRRFRKTFVSQAEAKHYEKHVIAEYKDEQPWEKNTKKDNRKLSDIAQDWYKFHGYTLKTGEERLQMLEAIIRNMGDCIASNFDPLSFVEYRKKRLASGITENHLNHELAYLKSCFNELIRLGNWKQVSPLNTIKKLKFDEKELTFLSFEQISSLMKELDNSLNSDLKIIVKICLSTGCRWGEAQKLTNNDIHNGKIHFSKTKNGKTRSIPIVDSLITEILAGRPRTDRLFTNASDAFSNAIDRAKIKLPKGQRTHVLRHTFASHFMMSGGNILDLNKILGHQTIQMTMVYAKLSPEHLIEAVKRNPLAMLN